MKKKILLVVLAGVLILTLGTATAFAASENFTDQNNDGVCDNYQSATRPLDGTGSQYRQCGGVQNGSGNGNGNQYGKK